MRGRLKFLWRTRDKVLGFSNAKNPTKNLSFSYNESENPDESTYSDDLDESGKAEEPTNLTPRNNEENSETSGKILENVLVETEDEDEEDESEEESTAWDESTTRNSRSMNESNQQMNSAGGQRPPTASKRETIRPGTQKYDSPQVTNNSNYDDEDEESSDDWMDELDKALENQGYNQ